MALTILGIADSHEAHACIVRDGKLVAAMAEERLSRLKSDMGYPRRSIDAVIEIAGIRPEDIDVVAVAGQSGNLFKAVYKHNALFKVKDWIKQCHEIWKPVLLEGKSFSHFEDFELWRDLRDDTEQDPYYPLIDILKNTPEDGWYAAGQEFRRDVISDHLGITRENIHFYRHEDCHKAYGFYSSPFEREKALVFTIEGGGDDSSATISTLDADGTMTEHWRSNKVLLGRLYRYVTLILGMQPGQHEYKVMGLAPYGTEYHGHRALEFFRTINSVEGTEIVNHNAVPDLYFSVKDALEGERFDGIAWGVQTYAEEILCEWVKNNIEAHGISNVILSGGVAQNIKACKAVAELPEVDQLWSGPISGDGSLGIGAAWLAARERDSDTALQGLPSIYLGTSYDSAAVDAAIEKNKLADQFHIHRDYTSQDVAKWLAKGHVAGRYSGQMEFGQRALGNRSILADPRRYDTVERINQKIKYRDFWMPFTPSMMVEEAERILDNPKNIFSPFMTLAFDLKPEYSTSIPAAQHPADKTVRPQMLRRADNPGYYDILKAFKDETGMGVLMNTSFNLHGEAIVETPDDAISTFLRSDIDVLLFDKVCISRVVLD
jgi:carbamoyltransferase